MTRTPPPLLEGAFLFRPGCKTVLSCPLVMLEVIVLRPCRGNTTST